MPAFYDSNILLYAIDLNPDEAAKGVTARALIGRTDWVISVQVLQEFFVQATRPSRPGRLSAELAAGFTGTWRRQPVQEMTLAVFDAALAINRRHGFAYWDCAIIAAAAAQGCETLYTEDMSHGQIVGGVGIVDPFR